MLRVILESPFMTVQGVSLAQQNVQDTDLYIVSAPNLPGGICAYAFVGNFLVFGRDAESLKAVIAAHASGENLAATPRFASAPVPFSGPVVFSDYVNLSELMADEAVFGQLRTQQPKLGPFVPAIAGVMARAGEIRVVGRATPRGIIADGDLAIPVSAALMAAAAGDYFGKPVAARKAKRAEERMKEVAAALRRYYQRNQAPPDTLVQLVPAYIEELPGDPFAGGAEFGYGISTGGSGWILVSVGPDGKRDIDLNDFTEEKWQAIEAATDPAVLEEARRLIYRFRPKQFADERGYDDEGDIVKVGRWQ
jgi:type II secretory pathway pseudopilin PulG